MIFCSWVTRDLHPAEGRVAVPAQGENRNGLAYAPCACDTTARLCVRTVLCSSAFLLVPPLPSIGSAAVCAALFAN
jgi:hypothetical protein